MLNLIFKRLLAFTAICTALALGAAAQTPPAKSPPPFSPGLGDLMTAFVQPRHIKLGLAGQARDWDYLAYEWSELEETFDLVEEQVPSYKKTAMKDLLAMIKLPMTELDAAIKLRDGAKFDAAYAALTEGCNNCHRTTQRAMIVIQAPKTSMFPDQNFAPQKP
jgi:hypothetical protein